MDIKKLNEELQKFLEGDVVSFTDYKNRKVAERRKARSQEFLKQHDAEMQKSLDDFNKNNILATIDKIKILSCEGPIDNPHFESGEEFSYENFQERLYILDYFNQIQDKVDKLDFEVHVSLRDGANIVEKLRCDIGDGREACDVYETLEMIISQEYPKNMMITNDPVKYNENYYKSLAKEYGIVAPKEEDPMDAPYVKDYSKGGTKTAMDVEVGDILYQIGGYSMTYYDYYKVIDKKNKSIKLASLGEKIVDGDGWRGRCIPDNNIVPDRDVDGKLFRIGAKYNNKVVCQVNGHACYYWDGKPDSFDRMD